MVKAFCLLVFFISSAFQADYHDIHVSVTDIEISGDGNIDVTVKVFLDDLMKSVGLEPGAELPEDYTSSDEIIKKFIDDNLALQINGTKVVLELEETTPSLPAVWINLIGHIDGSVDRLSLENKILIDTFEDQSNMINVTVAGKEYSEMLDNKESSFQIDKL